MKRTPLKRGTKQLKKTPLKKIGKKKQKEIKQEIPIRQQLLDRCKGVCEECGSTGYPFGLSPHEGIFRSHLGKLSLENTKMLCIVCHGKKHGIKYIVSK